MSSIDKNHSDDLRSVQSNKTGQRIANGHSTHNSDDNHAPSFAIAYPRMPFVDDSNPDSTTPPASLPVVIEELSIYDVRTNLKCKVILAIASFIAFLLTYCDTVYLPSLDTIQRDLKTNETLVIISVSIYLFMNGLFSIIWGPISDRFGRKITIVVALIMFVGASIGCIFSPSIAVLIVFRSIQGATVSANLVVGQGIVSDIYPVEKRGWATGIFFVPVLIGPILGPLTGGALSDALGWRSTFILLSILAFVMLVLVLITLPETHQYFVKENFHKANPNKRILDAVPNYKPVFEKPWKPLTFLTDLTILPYIMVSATTFTGLFVSLALFSSHIDEAPYDYSETITGVLFVPVGVIMFVGSFLGGWLSDKASERYGAKKCPEGRLVPAMAFAFLVPVGLIIYGWSFHYDVHIAVPIIGQVVLGFGQSVQMPGVFSYLTAKKQEHAAAVSAANTVVYFCAAGIFVTVAVSIEAAIGTGPFFCLICGINFVTIVCASILVYKQIRKANCVIVENRESALESTNTVAPANDHAIAKNEHHEKRIDLF